MWLKFLHVSKTAVKNAISSSLGIDSRFYKYIKLLVTTSFRDVQLNMSVSIIG